MLFFPVTSNSVLNRIRNNYISEEIYNISLFYVIIVGSLLVEEWVVSISRPLTEYGPHIVLVLESLLQIVFRNAKIANGKKK